ncbi:MAG: hypothetical protein ACKOPT_04135, partial [Cyanobium sp.]
MLDTRVNTRIPRRLGLPLLLRQLGPSRLAPRLWWLIRPPAGQRRRQALLHRLRQLNQLLHRYLHVSLPGPQRLAAMVSGTQPPTPGGEDAFIQRLRDSYQPRRLPLK